MYPHFMHTKQFVNPKMKPELLQSLFHDLMAYGSIRIKKSKLLWMLGRFHETPTAWDLLLREWAEFDAQRPIFAMHWGDEITLTMAPTDDIAVCLATKQEAPKSTRPNAPFLAHVVAS